MLYTLFLLASGCLRAQDTKDLANELRIRIESVADSRMMQVQGDLICCRQAVPQFYNSRFFEPAWNEMLAHELIESIRVSEYEGLNPKDYHLEQLEYLLGKERLSTYEKTDLELLLTDSFLLFSSHLMSGKVNPQTIDTDWKVSRREGDPVKLLNEALEKRDIQAMLEAVKPTFKAYKRLKDQLAKYRGIAEKGGWETIPIGETIKPDTRDSRIPLVRRRLRLTGDLKPYTYDEDNLYDEILQEAVKYFQKRHGLEEDANLGKMTLDAMNIPVNTRISQIELNLERCRWLPQGLGSKYIMVNLPAFELEMVNEGSVEFEMIVATGKPYRQTPVFSAKMTYLVFNPYWTIPPTILSQDIIPAQMKNPNFLNSLNIKIIAADGSIVPSSSINWATASLKNFRYTLRQDPGKNNALGQVKFIFPNPYNIYMHDTNHPEVFGKSDRALSSGCIRLSRPLELANHILMTDTEWSEEKTRSILKSRQNYSVILKSPIQVHMQYWTCFVDENGVLNFRKDIYSRDEKVLNVLKEPAPRI